MDGDRGLRVHRRRGGGGGGHCRLLVCLFGSVGDVWHLARGLNLVDLVLSTYGKRWPLWCWNHSSTVQDSVFGDFREEARECSLCRLGHFILLPT